MPSPGEGFERGGPDWSHDVLSDEPTVAISVTTTNGAGNGGRKALPIVACADKKQGKSGDIVV
jgi:hypothetical protein